jgi:hypothetical protein
MGRTRIVYTLCIYMLADPLRVEHAPHRKLPHNLQHIGFYFTFIFRLAKIAHSLSSTATRSVRDTWHLISLLSSDGETTYLHPDQFQEICYYSSGSSTATCSLIMLLNLEMRSPGVRSPEELRAFYSIALRAKLNGEKVDLDTGLSERATGFCDAQSVPWQDWASSVSDQVQPTCAASSISGRADSSSWDSLISYQAQSASSTTSISEMQPPTSQAKTPSPEAVAVQLRLRESYSLFNRDIHLNDAKVDLVTEEENADLELCLSQSKGTRAQIEEDIEDTLSAVRSIQLYYA